MMALQRQKLPEPKQAFELSAPGEAALGGSPWVERQRKVSGTQGDSLFSLISEKSS